MTGRRGTSTAEETISHHVAPRDRPTTDAIQGGSSNLRLVRMRLFLALITMFAIPISIATPVVYARARGEGASLMFPILILIALAFVLGLLTVWLAHRVLEPAERLAEVVCTLEGAYDQARSEALIDHLTQLGNHRAFQEEMERQWSAAVRHNRPLALVLLDLDEFKQINDSDGHANGDLQLRRTGLAISASLRRADRAFRVGGDEFAIILPDTDGDVAYLVIRRLLATCLEAEDDRGKSASPFSAGISAIPGSARDRETLYSHADAALYWGKRHGRTCATLYDRRSRSTCRRGRSRWTSSAVTPSCA